jgi:hypothetical protein
VVVFTLLALPTVAQNAKQPSNEELVSAGDRLRDATVLRSLSKLKVGLIDVSNSTDLSVDEGRKLVFGIFSRYNLPVDWTPTTQSVTVDVPTIMAYTTFIKQGWSGGFTTNYVRVHIELLERIKLPREKIVEWDVPIWAEDHDEVFGSTIDKSAVVEIVKKLTEQFCLSYLSANR